MTGTGGSGTGGGGTGRGGTGGDGTGRGGTGRGGTGGGGTGGGVQGGDGTGGGGLALWHARVRYGPLEALHGVTLVAPGPGLTVLLGRNGSGRTTALRALAGTVPLTAGSVLWDGADVTRVPAQERVARGLCFVPERQAVFGSLTVAENLELAARSHGFTPALEAYPELRPLLPRRAGTLSGGEQRMLALSRSLVSHARVVLVDEPAQGMAPAVASRTYALLGGLDACVVVAEQRLPADLRTRAGVVVYELLRGGVVFAGEAAELGSGPRPTPSG